MPDPSPEHLNAVARLSPTDRRLNIEFRLRAELTKYGGERVVDGLPMERLVQDLANATEKLGREGFLPPRASAPRPSVHNPITKSYAIDQITDIEHLRRVAHRMWEAFAACHAQSAHAISVLMDYESCTQCSAHIGGDSDLACEKYQAWQRKIRDGFGSV